MKQTRLGYEAHEAPSGAVPSAPVAPKKEPPRLSPQAARVLDRLAKGPATNRELSQIALSYRRRIADIRQNDIEVEIIRKEKNGINTYALKRMPRIEGRL